MDLNWLLKSLYNSIPSHTGSWGTKDFGITEGLQSLFAPNKAYASSGGSDWDQSSATGLTQDAGGGKSISVPVPRLTLTDTASNNGGGSNVLGAGTGGGTGGAGVDTSGVDLARQAYEARVNAIRSLFDQTKQRANDVRSEADRTFGDLLKAVGAFRDRSKGLFDTADQQITNNASEILGSNARTAAEQEGNLRAKGRALGLGDSSKFKLQTGLAGRLAGQQGETLATRGENKMSNQNLFQERQDTAQSQEDEANRYKTSLYDEARRLENTGVDSFGDNMDTAANSFGTSLNNILNYQRQLAAINPLQASSINAYSPDFSNVKDAISKIVGTPLAGGNGSSAIGGGMTAANATSPTNILELLKRNRGLYA